MPLTFQPKAKAVVICDFHGYVIPEMIKKRPVVVLAHHKRNSKLVTVVPLSTTPPTTVERHHHQLSANPLPGKPPDEVVWAKCDMVATVSLARLDRYRVSKRSYVVPVLSDEDFRAIQFGVRHALGLDTL